MTILTHEKEIAEYEKTLSQVQKQKGLWSETEIKQLQKKLEVLKKEIYTNLKPMQRVQISRHPNRPQSMDYIENLCEEFEPIYGDRTFADDSSIVMGFGKIQEKKFFLIGQQKGKDTESRLHHNFGMTHPEGYRKALRGMRLAAKFGLPVVTFLDTPGAYAGLAAEERGQGWAIAKNLWEMSQIPTPILVVLIGEGCSGGALGIGVGDQIAMLEHAYYSVISPEGCASILWKDAQKSDLAATALKMQAENLLKMGIIDEMIREPLGGAHHDPETVYQNVREFLLQKLDKLSQFSLSELLEKRYEKFRKIGTYNTIVPDETSSESSHTQ